MNRMKHDRYRFTVILLPVLAGCIMVVLLQTKVIHSLFGLGQVQLPLPSDTGSAFAENAVDILRNTAVTLIPAISGMAAGCIIGYVTALIAVRFPRGGYGSLILMTAVNSVPAVALASVMNCWFDTALVVKAGVAAVMTMGVMTVNAYKGLDSPGKAELDLMELCGASRLEVFTKLRIPASIPDVFSALKLNCTIAMMGTIISEFFASETAGLGFMIKYCLRTGNQKDIGWAYILAATILSLALYGLVCIMEKRILHWHVSVRKTGK